MSVRLIQLGIGLVGRATATQILEHGKGLVYSGLYGSKGGIFDADGLPRPQIDAFLRSKEVATVAANEAVERTPKPFIVIDATASDQTIPLLKQALARGGAVVTANKKPLAGRQADFDELVRLGGGRLCYETTVGGGLPVIATLQSLLATGDDIVQIQGCFSGTLGFIFSELEHGGSFSTIVKKAKESGFTEPDPRDDLSGADVARKTLILARLLGQKLELSDIKQQGLLPESMAALTSDDFMTQLGRIDDEYAAKAQVAKKNDCALRYVATISPNGCRVGLESVPKSSDIGRLHGPDNIVVMQTKRYFNNPLVIKGPGAGAEVTAAGLFADIIKASTVLQGEGV